MARAQRLLWIALALGLLLATVANGAYAYLARIGLLEQANYKAYVASACGRSAPVSSPTLTCWCRVDADPPLSTEIPSPAYLYRAYGSLQLLAKLPKEAWFAVFVLLSLAAWARREASDTGARPPWPVLALSLVLAVGAAFSVASSGVLFTALSLRPFEFLAIALLASWYLPGMPVLARWLAGLLLVEAILVGVELMFGLPTMSCPKAFRAAGSLVQPSSFGIFVAGVLAFIASVAPELLRNKALWLLAAVLVFCAASATGILLLLALAGWLYFEPRSHARLVPKLAGIMVLAALFCVALPALTHRPDLYDSLFGAGGRVEKLANVIAGNGLVENLFGRGLGIGTNQTSLLALLAPPALDHALRDTGLFYADSTITWLVIQFGLCGVIAFYALLAWAFATDRRLRPFYLVLAIASLTINIPEVFPVNVLLGLALAHSLSLRRPGLELPAVAR